MEKLQEKKTSMLNMKTVLIGQDEGDQTAIKHPWLLQRTVERREQHPQSLIKQTVLEIWGLETGKTSIFRIFVGKDERTVGITDKSQGNKKLNLQVDFSTGHSEDEKAGHRLWGIYFHICLSSNSWGWLHVKVKGWCRNPETIRRMIIFGTL